VSTAVIWHDLECGRYEQDLPLWHSLSDEHVTGNQALLDIGAGTGRVTLSLAQAGFRAVALDRDRELLAELDRRAAGLPVETICSDARDFAVSGRSFPLIAAPMQTVQLLGGADGHRSFLAHARAHLSPGGVVAMRTPLSSNDGGR